MRFYFQALLIICWIAVGPAAAELQLELVDVEDSAPQGKRLQAGTKIRPGGGQGGTAMHWMAFNGDEDGVRELIISGSDIDDRVKKGGTPLHLAAYNGHTRVARLLIEHGADVNARTNAGITPLDWAQRNGHEEVVNLLIAHGARATKAGQTWPAHPVAAGDQGAAAEVPEPAVVRRRSAPLMLSLMRLPEDSVVVMDKTETSGGQPKKPVPTGGYRIQLGAFSSEQRAVDAWARYRERFPEILAEWDLILDRVSVKGKLYHRAQTGPMGKADALAICDRLKPSGQACAVVKQGSP